MSHCHSNHASRRGGSLLLNHGLPNDSPSFLPNFPCSRPAALESETGVQNIGAWLCRRALLADFQDGS
jgi:hypothetical protein